MAETKNKQSVFIEKQMPGTFHQFILIFITFFAGASIMVIELAANRTLSPWFGNSLFTWTSLIGVILVAMSLGSFLGGLYADKNPSFKFLGHLLMLSSLLTIMIPLLQKLIDGWFENSHIIWGPLAACLILFSLPAIFLGGITPLVIRLISLMGKDLAIGFSAGRISMFSTLGSVFGTFLTGIWLIPHFEIKVIYLSVALLLGILASISYYSFYKTFNGSLNENLKKKSTLNSLGIFLSFFIIGVVICLGLIQQKNQHEEPLLVYEKSTFYHRIRVFSQPLQNGDTLKSLFLDTTTEGAQFEQSKEIPLEYQKYWELIKFFQPQLKSAAFLGGGAFAMPLAVKDSFPQADVDVIEIDPEVIHVGKKFFNMGKENSPNTVADDARRYLRNHSKTYDFIFGDTYNGLRYIPPHLITKEFFELIKNRLNPDGIYMINIISSLRGNKSELFQSVVKTLHSVFPQLYVFALNPDRKLTIQNIILVASPIISEEKLKSLEQIHHKDVPSHLDRLLETYIRPVDILTNDGVVITDSHNPVEYIIAKGLME